MTRSVEDKNVPTLDVPVKPLPSRRVSRQELLSALSEVHCMEGRVDES